MIYKIGKYTSDQLSIEAYHKEVEALSKTNLDAIHQSYQHYLASKEERSPLCGNIPKCLVEGQALHCLVLTPTQFNNEFSVLPALNRRTREGKALYDQIVSQGKPVVSAATFGRLEAMGGSILNHPTSILLKDGVEESSYIWKDPDTDLLCKCRPDYLRSTVIVDIKTCQDASYDSFQRDIIDHRYHVQGAYFIDGVSATLNDKIKRDFVLIAVEKSPPFAVAAYKLDGEALEIGRDEYKRDLQKYKTHVTHPELWQGYSSGVMEMDRPNWAKRNKNSAKSVSVEVLI
jgi:exodeoxyribonuclease VIII